MNLAKAAPSAPVKKAARENPQILPGGLLILFFLLLAAGEAVQRHHNQHEKADDQQDTGHADEHTVKEVRPRYSCFYKIRHPGDCDGQSGYGVSKLDSIVEEVVRQIFAQDVYKRQGLQRPRWRLKYFYSDLRILSNGSQAILWHPAMSFAFLEDKQDKSIPTLDIRVLLLIGSG